MRLQYRTELSSTESKGRRLFKYWGVVKKKHTKKINIVLKEVKRGGWFM